MRIAITGSSGMIGTALASRLREGGNDVYRVVRSDVHAGTSRSGTDEIAWSPTDGRIDADAFDGLDGVVNLAGANIGARRWNDRYKKTLRASRLDSTALVARTIAESSRPPSVLISASGVNAYGDRGDEVLDESSPTEPGAGFLADLCRDWEAAAQPAASAGARVVTTRSGVVFSADDGALRKQLPLFRFGLGARMGSGRQWLSWISLDDEVAAIKHLLTSELRGPVNLTAPQPVTNAEFTKELGRTLGRPTLLRVPTFGPRLVLGAEMADSLLFDSLRVVPKALLDDGFEFRHATVREALAAVVSDRKSD